MVDLNIRAVGPDDIEVLAESMSGLSREDAGQRDPHVDVSWAGRDAAEFYRGSLGDPGSLMLLAWEGGPAVGHLAVGHLVGRLREPTSIRPHRFAVLESMRVAPSARGRGVGSRLVREFFAWARSCGAAQAVVTAYAANEGARRFYGRHGFTLHEVSMRAPI